jgi:hypothetical protein
MRRISRLTLGLALPAVAAAAVLGSSASAQSPAPAPLTLTELDRGSTFTHIRNTKTSSERSNSQGDLIVFTNPLADASGDVVGRLHVSCVTTTGARDFRKSVMTCGGIMVLRGGTLTLQASVSPNGSRTTGAITGGTGSYANARGVFTSQPRGRNSVDTITLAP